MHLLRILACLILAAASVGPATGATLLSSAHRGGSLYAPENTLAAFSNSLAVTDLMETDVQITSDGKFVIMHDTTVDRTTDGTGPVAAQTLAQLKLLDAGSWYAPQFTGQRIPTLEEMIIATLPAAVPFIEVKAGGAAAYVSELRRLNVVTNVILQSFDWNFLAQVHALEPAVRLCALGSGTMSLGSLITITNAGARMVSWAGANVRSNEVHLAHSLGLQLLVWTINSRAEITNFIAMGVDGIVSDDPWAVRGLPPPGAQTNPPPAPSALREQLVAYWRMDDGLTSAFATAVTDSASSNHATLVRNDGQSHWLGGSDSMLGGGLQLAGSNAFVHVPPTAALDLGSNELSLSAWVRLDRFPAQLPTSFGAIYDSAADCYVLYLDKANNELRFKVTDASGQAARPGVAAAFLRTNEWLHLAAVFNGNAGAAGTATIYLNGTEMDRHVGNDGTPGVGLLGNVKPGQVAAMGREGPTGGNDFHGAVDDFAIWRRALMATEVNTIFQAGVSGQSLGDLLIQPTPLLTITSIQRTPMGLVVEFQKSGPWNTFRLRQATNVTGVFAVVTNLAPVALGNGYYRFEIAPPDNSVGFYRIEGQ